jgi:OOP family OmpA-OmpF porin
MEAAVRIRPSIALCAVLWALCLMSSPVRAQNLGFQINRYEPTTVGEWSFLVDHPWYSSTRYFAAGVTLNYAHNPLVYGFSTVDNSFRQTQSIIQHQLLGHVDLAGSFLDRVTIAASLPVTFLERGQRVGDLAPVSGAAVGDPRLTVMGRLFGQPDRSPVSLSIGASVWIPLRKIDGSLPPLSSDLDVRILPKLIAGGLVKRLRWSFTAGFLYRPDASLGTFLIPDGSTTGSSLQLGAAISYADVPRRFAIGPEMLLSTVVAGGHAFQRDFTSLEILLGVHYNIAGIIQVGAAGGLGILREPGTPDGRALLRIAYAPMAKPEPPRVDSDSDGIDDRKDACPLEAGPARKDPRTNGCPPPDRDRDGTPDERDVCPAVPSGNKPDPARPGCPIPDRDDDGVLDAQDQCPDVAQGSEPDPAKPGCPDKDTDKDGVVDSRDQCPSQPKGDHPDPAKLGCPDKDTDSDGVFDAQDQCLKVPAGGHPDPAKPGCPMPDRDGDSVVDNEDACPTRPGAPDPDPKKNGCPGLVTIKKGQIVILRSVFFANDEAVILKNSFPVLQAVANVLTAQPQITKLGVEGHTDDRGDVAHNLDLSKRRAQSVMQWLTEHGIAAGRLTAEGFGPNRPISDNKTLYGRAKNRRVEFHILEPSAMAQPSADAPAAATAGAPATPAPTVAPASGAPEPSPTDAKPGKKVRGKKGKADKDADAAAKPKKKRRSKKKDSE